MSHSGLNNQVTLITGASRGIGLATARQILIAGGRVVLGSKNADRLERAVGELTAYGETAHCPINVADYEDMEAFVKLALERFGRVDSLINNAGSAWAGPFADMPPEVLDAIVDDNIRGVLNGARAIIPHLIRQARGTVINISSGAGHTGIPGLSAYCASKFAVNGLTEALAGEVGSQGVAVYAICPGRVATDMQKAVSGRRQGMPPEKVADAVLRLLGPKPPIRPGQCLDLSS